VYRLPSKQAEFRPDSVSLQRNLPGNEPSNRTMNRTAYIFQPKNFSNIRNIGTPDAYAWSFVDPNNGKAGIVNAGYENAEQIACHVKELAKQLKTEIEIKVLTV